MKLQESLDIVDESNRFFESKIGEYEKIVNSWLIHDWNIKYL